MMYWEIWTQLVRDIGFRSSLSDDYVLKHVSYELVNTRTCIWEQVIRVWSTLGQAGCARHIVDFVEVVLG